MNYHVNDLFLLIYAGISASGSFLSAAYMRRQCELMREANEFAQKAFDESRDAVTIEICSECKKIISHSGPRDD